MVSPTPDHKTRLSNTQIAVRTLKRLILENELKAGSNYLENELASKIGMSRTPVRESALILEGQGLLEIIPRRGIRVVSLTADEMGEIYQILSALEGLSVQLAAEQYTIPSDFKDAEAAILQMDEALMTDDRESWAVADQKFHSELVRLGGNKRVASIVEVYNAQVHRVRSVTLYQRPVPTKSNDDHRRLLEAIRNHEPKIARALHEQHLLESRKMMMALLKKHSAHNT